MKIESPQSDMSSEQAVQSVLAKYEYIQLAILFGSLASGTARADSDLDLAVDVGHKLDAAEKMKMIDDLAAATGMPIDLVDIQSIGEPLLGQILQHGKRFVGSNTRYAELIRKHLDDFAEFAKAITAGLDQ